MRTNRARLTVVDVIQELPRDLRMLVSSVHLLDLQKLVIKDRTQDLEAILAPLRDDGLRDARDARRPVATLGSPLPSATRI